MLGQEIKMCVYVCVCLCAYARGISQTVDHDPMCGGTVILMDSELSVMDQERDISVVVSSLMEVSHQCETQQ